MLFFKTKNLEPPFKMRIIKKDSDSIIQFRCHSHFQKRSSLDFCINTKQNLSLSENIENKLQKIDDKLSSQKANRVHRKVFAVKLNQSQEIREQAYTFIPRISSKKKQQLQTSRNKSQNFEQHHCQQYPILPCLKIQKAKQFQKSDQQPIILKSKKLSNQNHSQINQLNTSGMRKNLIILKIDDNLQNSTILLKL